MMSESNAVCEAEDKIREILGELERNQSELMVYGLRLEHINTTTCSDVVSRIMRVVRLDVKRNNVFEPFKKG